MKGVFIIKIVKKFKILKKNIKISDHRMSENKKKSPEEQEFERNNVARGLEDSGFGNVYDKNQESKK